MPLERRVYTESEKLILEKQRKEREESSRLFQERVDRARRVMGGERVEASPMDLCVMMTREVEERDREQEEGECSHADVGEDEHVLLCFECG